MINQQLPTPYFKSYSTLASAVVMITDDPGAPANNATRMPYARSRACSCCRIIPFGAGTLVIRPPWGAAGGGDDVTITATAGVPIDIEAERIVSGTATNVLVLWPRSTEE